MTIDKARELLGQQTGLASGYNRGAIRIILAEVHKVHGQTAVDQMIREFDLTANFDLEEGTDFSSVY